MIEEQLAKMCVIFSGTPENGRANSGIRRLFGSIESSGARRNALRYMAEIHFGDGDDGRQMKNKLNSLLAGISKASKRRDDLAHGVVASFSGGKRPIGSFLLPSSYNSERNKPFFKGSEIDHEADFPWHILPGEYRYNSSDIDDIRVKFEQLLEFVWQHAAEFSGWKTPLGPS